MALLSQMRFHTTAHEYFGWPNNPSECTVEFNKRIITHEYPEKNGTEYELLGLGQRVISGTGIFYGPDAYDNFKRLTNFYSANQMGDLVHPTWGIIRCVFSKLEATQEPQPDFVEYRFEFMEHNDISVIETVYTPSTDTGSGGSSTSTTNTSGQKYTVISGDSLWKISKKFYGTGTKWQQIADANKSVISNPNVLQIGWVLTIP